MTLDALLPFVFQATLICGVAALGIAWRASSAVAIPRGTAPRAALLQLWALTVDGLFVCVSLLAILLAIFMHTPLAVLAGLMGLAALFPYPVAKAVFVPMGGWQAAWQLAVLSHVSFSTDRRGGAVATAAHALMRKPSPGAVAHLERMLAGSLMIQDQPDTRLHRWIGWILRMPEQPRANALYAVGAICAASGDLSGARRMFAEVEYAPDAARAAEALRQAREWRCADAVERGDWREVRIVGELLHPSPTARVRFMAGVARRMLGENGAPDHAALTALWARCPGRKLLEPLLERARAIPLGPPPPPAVEHEVEPNALTRALTLHMRVSRGGATQPAEALRALGHAWNAVLTDPTFRSTFSQRAQLLGAPEGAAVLDDLAAQVREQLAAFVIRDGVGVEEIEGSCPLLRQVARQLRDERLRALETSVAALQRRIDDDRRLPGRTEQQELEALARQYLEVVAVTGKRGRENAFHVIYQPLSAYGVWLFNKRRQRRLGHGVFCFLMMQACIVGDEAALGLQARNANIGY